MFILRVKATAWRVTFTDSQLTHGEIVGQGSQLHGNRQNNKTQAAQHSPVGRILGSVWWPGKPPFFFFFLDSHLTWTLELTCFPLWNLIWHFSIEAIRCLILNFMWTKNSWEISLISGSRYQNPSFGMKSIFISTEFLAWVWNSSQWKIHVAFSVFLFILLSNESQFQPSSICSDFIEISV